MDDPFAAAGTLRPSYAAVDWERTPLGAVADWDATLRSAVDLVLSTRFPVTLLWGAELVMVYNESYVQMISGKHPIALGRPCAEVFPEAWSSIGPMLHGVLTGGAATWSEDQLLLLDRSGFLEETFFTFSYSPVRGSDGTVEGVIDIAMETTAKVVTARRLATLARLNQRLTLVQRLDEIAEVLADVLGGASSDVLAVSLRMPEDSGVAAPSGDLARVPDPRLPLDTPPGLGNDLEIVRTAHGPVSWVPVAGPSRTDSVLVLLLSSLARLDEDYLDFVRLVGSALAQHLERLRNREAERTLSAALQASLLSPPQHSPTVEIAVRYQPAAELAQVGGDWYDSFRLADGDTMLVVGDVAGHDHGAAASMGQVRNLLRGVAYLDRAQVDRASPAAVISALERTMVGLDVQTLATAVVGDLRHHPDGSAGLRWSNAGHLPPVVVGPDGSARLLETAPDLLVGMQVDSERHDHEVTLAPGSTLVLYTDGLVERRGVHLDDSLRFLVEVLEGCHVLSAERVCDLLLTWMGAGGEDDVALVVVRLSGGPREARR